MPMDKPSLLHHMNEILALLQEGPAGLFLDLDGTLAKIVPTPEEASVREPIRSALVTLASRFSVVSIVTGRQAVDARAIVGLDQLTYIGNHGLERMEEGKVSIDPSVAFHEEHMRQVLEELRTRCGPTDASFEEKRASFAVHYRNSRHPEATRDLIMSNLKEVVGDKLRVLMGKAHVNVLPQVPLNKGTAVCSLIREQGLRSVLVAGDDFTDADSFREVHSLAEKSSLKSVAVAVLGEECPPDLLELSDYTLASVKEMEMFLVWLAHGPRLEAP